MPQEPKKKHSKARKRTRRAGIMLKSLGLTACKNCNKLTLPHQVCKYCGHYGDKKIEGKVRAEVVRA